MLWLRRLRFWFNALIVLNFKLFSIGKTVSRNAIGFFVFGMLPSKNERLLTADQTVFQFGPAAASSKDFDLKY